MANAFVMDWMMLWKEVLGGFLIAGFIATLVPPSWWQTLFLENGPAPLRLIENALIGPIIAILSFVCSVGNIPLASHLWANGISFGGVVAFIYGDLLVVPLILIYAKYYGARATGWIVAIFYVTMVLSGVVVDLLFSVFGIVPTGAAAAERGRARDDQVELHQLARLRRGGGFCGHGHIVFQAIEKWRA